MQTETYAISDSNLQNLLQALINGGQKVIAPVRSNNKVLFKEITDPTAVCTDHIQTALSAKHLAFPRTETLFSYKKTGKDIAITDFNYDQIPSTILWGSRPCDAAGFAPLSAIFNWDISDEIYNKRLQKLTLISFSCTKHDESCFCTSVNGGPGNTAGSDILVTSIGNGTNLAEILTEKGKAIVDKHPGFFENKGFEVNKDQYLTLVEKIFDPGKIKEKVDAFFESDAWKKQAARCLGCGACAYVCPACACFDIQDDKHGNCGSRLRCWDSCGFQLFTLHTSGHNPRETQSRRWRQRIMHKFSYMPDRINVAGCTGCGRCSRACPVDMSISEHLQTLIAETK
ncbi:MAG: 4Fe-4S dicluster domain-containing protein [Breznakibacter sp.]